MKNTQILNIIFAALFTAIIAVSAQIAVVTPAVSLTLQTFGVALCGYTLSAKWSAASVFTYILAGALGLPIFSFFRGGIQMLLGPTGGFILGFIALAVFCSIAARTQKNWLVCIFSVMGILSCHILGIVQYSFVTSTGFFSAFLLTSLPFLLKDAVSLIGAFFVAKYLQKLMKKRTI